MTSAQDEVVELCSELIRFDTSNPTSSERAAAEWVTGKLDEVGVVSRLYESEPGRASVVTRVEGADQSRPALLLHGHLDVVPADAADRDEIEALIGRLGGLARMVGATLSNTANPTMLEAGYKSNVIPSSGSAVIDGRFLPGEEEEFERQLDALIGTGVVREWVHRDQAVETDFDGPLVEAMAAALRAEDSAALPVPYTMSGGTDAKSFERLGMRCFGFSPLLLPADLDFAPMFHGIDERVPTEALRFGARVLRRFVAAS